MQIEINDPNIIGEHLRKQFYTNDGVGGYSNFVVQEDVKKLPVIPIPWMNFESEHPQLITEKVDPEYPESYEVYQKEIDEQIYKMFLHWDHDGEMVFLMPDGKVVASNDCKKNNRWKMFDDWKSYHIWGV